MHGMQPRSHVWRVNGLDHHVLEWEGAHEGRGGDGATVVIVHGFQDAAATWEDVAGELAGAGLRVLAPDMRGFGDGPRVPPARTTTSPTTSPTSPASSASTYSGVPLFLIGHSMGATVVSYFAGAFPERVTKLALIDGVGPPDNPPDVAPIRMRRWIETAYEGPATDRKPMTPVDALAAPQALQSRRRRGRPRAKASRSSRARLRTAASCGRPTRFTRRCLPCRSTPPPTRRSRAR